MTVQRICIRACIRRMPLLIIVLSGSLSSSLLAADDLGTAQIGSQIISQMISPVTSSQITSDRQKISDEELDTLRGGFALPSGLIVDFSFDKRIYQNGMEAFYTYFELPQDLQLSHRVTADLASNFTNMLLNSVVQNNLDNQIIKTINTVNIDISNIKNVNFDANRSAFFRDLVGPTYK